MKRVGIFTKHSMQPRHPRIVMEQEILTELGYEVEVIANTQNLKGNQGSLIERLRYYLSFTYFHWPLIHQFGQELARFDTVIIYDFALLPLVEMARKLGKQVVYETIDNNVAYTFHALTHKMPFLKALEGSVTRNKRAYETKVAGQVAHSTIVNSPALRDFIGTPNIVMNLYASPFESIELESDPSKPLAYLYLGEFTHDKGGKEMLDIAETSGRQFLVYGNVKGDDLKARIASLPNVQQQDRINVSELLTRLQEGSKHYRFAGFSLIKPVNLSFATQEANKDIDYLALGIPLVANERGITKEKVDAGCGVMASDPVAMQRLADDPELYAALSQRSKEFYAEGYSRAAFTKGLQQALERR